MLFEFLLGAAAIYAYNALSDNAEEKKKEENRKKILEIKPYIEEIKRKIRINGYLSSSFKNKIKKLYEYDYNTICNSEDKFLDAECLEIKKDFINFIENYNVSYIEKEKSACKDLFQIGKYKLDDEQQTAVVTDEDNNLVIAGAGSGKTLTIMGKVNYLVKRKNIDPKDILLIAFARKAKEEMTDRIQSSGINVEAQTFHGLGLDIIGQKLGFKPKIAEENYIKDFLINYFANKVLELDNYQEIIHNLVEYFAYYINSPTFLEDCKVIGEKYKREKSLDLRTLESQIEPLRMENITKKKTIKREQLKSVEEVHIANFLFLNGVEYDYERPYTHQYKNGKKIYTPDFCIYINGKDDKENCIWLEHFGIDKDNKITWLDYKYEKKYRKEMNWKRKIHKKNNTILEETHSYEFRDNTINEKLNHIIQKYNITRHNIDYGAVYNSLRLNFTNKCFCGFIDFCITFINLFKSNGFKIEDIDNLTLPDSKMNIAFHKDRLIIFKKIIKNIIIEYERSLKDNNLIDFSDMIIEATNIIKASHVIHNDKILEMIKEKTDIVNNDFIIHNYKYVIIDEFQDISYARSKLIKAIIDKTKAHLFCVGDDWQAIFRFAGSDIGIFLKFQEVFGNTQQMKISKTYRNSQDLINLASKFIQKNPNQIKKSLYSDNKCNKPVRFYMYSNEYPYLAIEQAIDDFIKDNTGNDLMILGRTNFDKDILDKSKLFKNKKDKLVYVKNENLNIEFLTAHKSKGLEADNVIILNFNNENLGFPNQIVDDPLLGLVLSVSDVYQYAEERRLLYVALTRTKNRVSLITNIYNSSVFLKDLEDDSYTINIMTDGEKRLPEQCPYCKTGYLIAKRNTRTQEQFFACTNFPICTYTRNDTSVLQEETKRQEFENQIIDINKIEQKEIRIIEKKEKISYECPQYAYFNSISELERNRLQKVPFNITNKGVIYIYKYYPSDDLPNNEVRNAMLKYKNYSGKNDDDKIAFSNFTHDIYYLLEKIIKEYKLVNNIYLVSAPCHLREKISPINLSIKKIIEWTTKGHELRCNLVDYSDLLIRSSDIEEETKGTRDIEKQLNSIDVSKPLDAESTYILLDDITTSGITMDACIKKMIENGANEDNIICAAITSTSRSIAMTAF